MVQTHKRFKRTLFISVTEGICTLCLCCCTLYVALSVFFRVWTSFNLLRICYVLLFWTSLKDLGRECERKREAIPVASCRYHQQKQQQQQKTKTTTSSTTTTTTTKKKKKKKKEEEIKQEFLAVARLLLPASNLLLPSTVYIRTRHTHSRARASVSQSK